MLKKFSYLMLALCGAVAFTSCEQKEEPIVNTDPEPIGDPKEYFEQTALQFMGYFKPQDQKEVYELLYDFAEEYGDYSIESAFEEVVDNNYMYAIKNYAVATADVLRTQSYNSAVASNIWKFATFSGVLEPNHYNGRWEYTTSSNDLILKFTLNGKQSEIKVVASDDYWVLNDVYDVIQVPKTITITFKVGSVTKLTQVVKSAYDENACTASAEVSLSAANLKIVYNINADNSQIVGSESLSVNNTEVCVVKVTVNGSNLCNRTRLENGLDDEEDILNFVNDGSTNINILNRVVLKSVVKNIDRIVYADYDGDSASDAKRYVNILNENINTSFYLGGQSDKSGDVLFYAKKNTYDHYYGTVDYWDTNMMLQFTDDSQYDISSYFSYDEFKNVVDKFENLIESYENMLGY